MFFTLLFLLHKFGKKKFLKQIFLTFFQLASLTVSKILQSNCISQSKKYVPIRSLWHNRVFTDLANSHENHCLTIDCSYKNQNGSARYRSAADNPDQQVCYFNKPNVDEYYNVFMSKPIKADNFSDGVCFKIESLTGKTEKENFDAKKTSEGGASYDRFSKKFSITKPEETGTGKRHGDSIEHLYRRDRKSARTKFLSGR